MAAAAAAAAAPPVAAAVRAASRRQARALCAPAKALLGPRRLRLVFGATCLPKSESGPGEDAYFASHPLAAFGLADGVGSWTHVGVDAGAFARSLLRHAYARLQQRAEGGVPRLPNLPDTARTALEAVHQEALRGSCTLLLAQLHQDLLSVLNLGDCGILIMRPMTVHSRFHGGLPDVALRVLYRSTPMLHRPNMPLQLSSEDATVHSLEPFDLVTVRLRRGDLLVAGTDGLFDNVGDRELSHRLLAHHKSLVEQPRAASEAVATFAEELGQHAARLARSAPLCEFSSGGKLDDIALVVGRAEEWAPTVGGGLLDNLQEPPEQQPAPTAASFSGTAGSAPSRGWPLAGGGQALGRAALASAPARGYSTYAGGAAAMAPVVRGGVAVSYRAPEWSYKRGGGSAEVGMQAQIGRLLGKGTYASAWELLPITPGGPKAVLKCFSCPDAATAAIFGRAAAKEAEEQFGRERRAGEELRVGPLVHPGHRHIAHLLSSAPRLEEVSCSPVQMLVYECAGEALERPAVLARLDLRARLQIVGQLLRAVALLRLHGVVHADINGENCCVDDNQCARLIDFGNALILESGLERAVACPRLEPLRARYLHHPRFPAAERYGFPLKLGQLIATIERPRGINVYSEFAYDPEIFPGNLAATPPETLRGMLQPGFSDVYGLGILLWWLLTGQETPFDIEVDDDRASFRGWASFYRLEQAAQRAELTRRLRQGWLPELGAPAESEVNAVANWLVGALAEAPEDRVQAATMGPLGEPAA